MKVRRSLWVFATVVATASSPLLACFSSEQVTAQADGGADATAFDDVAVPPDAGPDAAAEAGTAPDAGAGTDAPVETGAATCPVQAYLQALGASLGGTVIARDFTCPDGLDLDASTATLDFADSGWARAPQSFQFETTGDGGGGAYASDAGPVPDGGWDGGAPPIPPGVNVLTSFDLESGYPTVSGDLTLEIAGPFTITGNADLYVQGNLTIVASGPIAICGGIYTGGNVTIHQPTAAGITFGCKVPYDDAGDTHDYTGYIYSGGNGGEVAAVSAGDVDIATRGAVDMIDGYIYTGAFGSDALARSGNITVKAYGDITLGSTISSAYMYAASPCSAPGDAGACNLGRNGDIRFLSEGKITLDYDSYLYAGDLSSGLQGGVLSLRSAGGIAFGGVYEGYVYSGAGGNVELLTQGPLTLSGGSFAQSGGAAPTNINVLAQSVSLAGGSFLQAQGPGSSVTVNAAGDVTLDQYSELRASDFTCSAGGSVTLNAEGNLSITNGSYIAGGASAAGTSCSAAAGGNVIARVGGTITAPVPDAGNPPFAGGTGTPAGSVTQTPGAAVDVGVIDAQLQPSVTVVSLPFASTSSSLLFGQLGNTEPPSFFGAHLLVAPGAAAQFAPVNHAIGQPLTSGWRYRVLLQPRMFDPTALDGLVLRVP